MDRLEQALGWLALRALGLALGVVVVCWLAGEADSFVKREQFRA